MSQTLTDGEIVKAIVKRMGLTQEELATKLEYGRTKLNMALQLQPLDPELKKLLIEKLELDPDIFPPAPEVKKYRDEMLEKIAAQNEQIIKMLTELNKGK